MVTNKLCSQRVLTAQLSRWSSLNGSNRLTITCIFEVCTPTLLEKCLPGCLTLQRWPRTHFRSNTVVLKKIPYLRPVLTLIVWIGSVFFHFGLLLETCTSICVDSLRTKLCCIEGTLKPFYRVVCISIQSCMPLLHASNWLKIFCRKTKQWNVKVPVPECW